MPPHCDTMDGPVVRAAMRALELGNVNVALPWVYAGGEDEVRHAFERSMRARASGGEAAKVADQWFFETIVRVHRRGEGAAFEGVKPAGLDQGPVLAPAEQAIETGDPSQVEHVLLDTLRHGVRRRLEAARATRAYDVNDVPAARRHVNAVLDLELYAHHAYEALAAGHAHREASETKTAHVHAH